MKKSNGMDSKLLNFNHRLSFMPFASAILTVFLITTLFTLLSQAQTRYRSIGDIPLPQGYRRLFQPSNSFGAWLRKIPLKYFTTVYLYDGRRKFNLSAQYAVLDISVGKKDLQQCADAVMRLRAEYLKKMGKPICFSDNAHRA